MPLDVCFTVDLEPDCPPYLSDTFRGVDEGLPALLALLDDAGVPATFFTTAEVAERSPEGVRALVPRGHELGCHGVTHRAFTSLAPEEARAEIEDSARLLRTFAPVVSFRAPYLRFPDAYLGMLERAGFALDSSQARYKAAYHASRRRATPTTLVRVPASVTSSVLRLPRPLRTPYLAALGEPVVLFVHPWEFVDLTRERLRYDCRFNTGRVALDRVRQVLEFFRTRGARFRRMRELVPAAA
jgi:peptidoglycan/xylan/chitin deacetylase (PgdA/CDA1 family)